MEVHPLTTVSSLTAAATIAGAELVLLVLGGDASIVDGEGVVNQFEPPPATDALPEEVMVKQDGVWVRATWAQLVMWLGAGTALVASPLTDESGFTLTTESGDIITTEGESLGGTAPVGALLESNRLSELSDSVIEQEEAQSNLGLNVGDIMAVYTTAKS